jgi:hypothetical protein
VTLADIAIVSHECTCVASEPDLTPGQALEMYAHLRRRLTRRTRAYFAAKQRLMDAREEFSEVERLASQARVAWPVKAA